MQKKEFSEEKIKKTVKKEGLSGYRAVLCRGIIKYIFLINLQYL